MTDLGLVEMEIEAYEQRVVLAEKDLDHFNRRIKSLRATRFEILRKMNGHGVGSRRRQTL